MPLSRRKYIEREDGMVYCPKCGDWFTTDHFNISSNKREVGLHYICKLTKFKRKYTSAEDYPMHSLDYRRDTFFQRKYGITLKIYNETLAEQNYSCSMCDVVYSDGDKFVVDHCHETGKFRSILCNKCNSAIGRLNDNVELLKKAVGYLQNPITKQFPNLVLGYKNGWKRAKEGLFDVITARRRRVLWQEYKMSLDDYNRLFDIQNGCCAICERHQSELLVKLNVDHCHISGEVRGLLCPSCNSGIGFLNDDINMINKAIKYLEKYEL